MNKCIKCGSYAFNLYKDGIDQGGLCDVHYWQGRAHRAEALTEQPAQQKPFGYFKAEPFGWCDCAETDEGAVALYESPSAQRKPVCAWRREDDDHMPDTWRSECGVLWTFTDGGPTDNDMKHCCGCGAKLQEQNK